MHNEGFFNGWTILCYFSSVKLSLSQILNNSGSNDRIHFLSVQKSLHGYRV